MTGLLRNAVIALVLLAATTRPPPLSAQAHNIDDLPVVQVTEELRVGSVDDLGAGFARIAGLAVHEDGTMFVLDGLERHVVVLDANGNRLRTIGGPGEGPGEFSRPGPLGLKGDTLWVTDVQLQRVTLFSLGGEVLSTFPAGRQAVQVLDDFAVTSRARAVRADGLLDDDRLMRGSSPDSARIPRLLFDRTGAVVDTAWYELRIFPPPATYVTLGGPDWAAPDPPFDIPLYQQTADGVAVIERWAPENEDGRFTVTRIAERGDTLYRREYVYRARGFTDAFMEASIAARVETVVAQSGRMLASPLDAAVVERAFRDAIDFPRYQTPVSDVVAGADGSLWLRREDDGGSTFRWLQLALDGTPRAQVELPRSTSILHARGDVIHASERDDFDVPWLVRLRIDR